MTNLPKRLTVKITPEHLRDGDKRNNTRCPLALAITDAIDMPGAKIFVDYSIADILMFEKRKFEDVCKRLEVYKLSKNAKHFIRTYDDGKELPLLPITFHLTRKTKS